ncbi:hypothetical protein P8452_76954 [Trifolium repens]|nr:hypothetical protein P8452_76954 [Trifolium repens]
MSCQAHPCDAMPPSLYRPQSTAKLRWLVRIQGREIHRDRHEFSYNWCTSCHELIYQCYYGIHFGYLLTARVWKLYGGALEKFVKFGLGFSCWLYLYIGLWFGSF